MINVTFSNNEAISKYFDAGTRMIDILSSSGEISFINCSFKDNLAKSGTANVQIVRAESIVFDNC